MSGTALAIINTTYYWGRAYSEDRRDVHRDSRVGAEDTSSVRFQSLTVLGEKGVLFDVQTPISNSMITFLIAVIEQKNERRLLR